ncbi:cAMP-regulated phosphoprotein 19 [Anthonomus grandis grandis]|uniref:cAMP-regulated phosphoprotein 19 n=1 Tax=Anthonomus grandis grandis TaxID=2921223 RepID=UPI002165BB90|nr:cAMP-regulated phosphoprotein 19 [Anthonomus grandis grandis]XP_050308472.1 cAMP-regulated phosphoprotein 19 [Anthonomus grandis grandis]
MSQEQQEGIQENEGEAPASPQELEKMEEAKLKAKYPVMTGSGLGRGGHSAFLQKRLAKGQKFFDSGDYQMAKQKMGGINKPPLKVPIFQTGEAIPTPETVPIRKTSLAQPSKLATSTSSITMATTPTGHGPNIS